MNLTVKAQGKFAQRLAQRRAQWGAQPPIRILIRVPPDMKWWYFHEYGVAPYEPKFDPRGESDKLAAIWRNQKDALAFTIAGHEVLVTAVSDFPGLPAKQMVHNVDSKIREILQAAGRTALANGAADNPALLAQAVLESMDSVKEIIAASFDESLPGSSPEGKLKGATAGDEFRDKATIDPD